MERVTAVQLSTFDAEGSSPPSENPTAQEPTLSRALAKATRPPLDPVRRWALASMGISALLVISLAYSSFLLVPRLVDLHRDLRTSNVEAKSWGQQTQALTERTHQLETEVENLRHFIAKSAHEDVIFLKIMVLKPSIDKTLARTIALHVHKLAGLYETDPNLVLAIMSIESDFNPRAVSSVGALGLMQVMPQWKKVLGIEGDLQDVEVSIRSGLQVLGFYTEMYKDREMALTAYNRGPGPVDHALMKSKDYKNGYSAKVLAEYEKLKAMSVTAPR